MELNPVVNHSVLCIERWPSDVIGEPAITVIAHLTVTRGRHAERLLKHPID